VDTAGSQLVAATFARSIQTFPLDSLVPAPVVTEPEDTTSIGVAELIGAVPCATLLHHPFVGRGEAEVGPDWFGSAWSVWSASGQLMTSGTVQASRLAWEMSSWPAGMYVLRLEGRQGQACSEIVAKAANR